MAHPSHIASLSNLGRCLSVRFQQTGHLGDLDESVQLIQEALLLCPVGHPHRGHVLSILSTPLQSRFQETGQLEDLDNSIQLSREALLLNPVGHRKHGSSLSNLSGGLLLRFQNTGQLGDLDESVQLDQEALLLCPVGHPQHGHVLSNIIMTLQSRFQETGQLGDLDNSIQLSREALLLSPVGHSTHGSALSNLSRGLFHRFQNIGQLRDLDESVQLSQEALLLYPTGHPKQGASLGYLSLGLFLRFQQVLLLHPVGHQHHTSSLNNLSMGLNLRVEQTGNLGDLEEAVQLNREMLLLQPVGSLHHGTSLGGLSSTLYTLFKQTGHLGDLDESIQFSREALQLLPTVGHWSHGTLLNNLSMSLRDHFEQTGHLGDLDESVQLARELLLLHPVGHPDHGSSLNCLCLGLYCCFQQTGHLEDLTECVSASKESAEDIYSLVSNSLMAVSNWVEITRPYHDLSQSNLEAYITGLSLISRSLSMIPMISLQYQHLLSVIKLPGFVSDGASQAIQLGQLSLAVEMIEQGRGLLWSELRGLRTPMDRLQALDSSLVDELMQINHQLEILSTKRSMQNSVDSGAGLLYLQTDSHQDQMKVMRDPFGHSLSEKRHLLHGQGDIIEKIQKIPGFETFLGRKLFDELKPAAKHGPVIVVNCSRYRSDVLIVLEQNLPVLISLVEDFYEQAETLVEQLTEARSGLKASPKRYNHVLRATLKDLWDLLVSPVVTKLQELHIPAKSRIFWCPTSILTTLPLHAAGPILPGTRKFLPDLYISSYTPTLTALIDAFNTTKSSPQLPHLLVAGQYNESLPRTKEEIHEVLQYQKHIPTTSVEGPATKEALEKALVDHEWLHIASHGTLVPKEPFGSYFSLADHSRFTLLDIIRLNLPNATFAFLSACHTAEQSLGSVHDEVLHLAAAMQFCGFRSVVGTLWEMADVDGPDMVKDFYSHLFSDENVAQCNEIGAQARALSEAIRKMRGRKGVTLERWVNFVHIGA
ncbi:CHAT domain-containing protein [Rhodocollybia butyracea]|uniref:CHAT domain-containing protein n=1 Tax=Rhodocollybia butyracea TaxID=206335 RepID=A0A9P5PGD0_9AGAR|nr:CHAT domain-containing protein [Rhodocollybia butyracea]